MTDHDVSAGGEENGGGGGWQLARVGTEMLEMEIMSLSDIFESRKAR